MKRNEEDADGFVPADTMTKELGQPRVFVICPNCKLRTAYKLSDDTIISKCSNCGSKIVGPKGEK